MIYKCITYVNPSVPKDKVNWMRTLKKGYPLKVDLLEMDTFLNIAPKRATQKCFEDADNFSTT